MSAHSALVAASSLVWARALDTVPHETYHLPAWTRLDAELAGGRPVAFVHEDAGSLLLLPLVLRAVPGSQRVDAASPYGYPGPVSNSDDPAFWRRGLRALERVLRVEQVVSCFVRLDPLFPPPTPVLREAGTLVGHGETVSIDLRRSPEAVYAGFRSNHRRQIARARARGRRVLVDEWSLLDDFVDAYRETMSRVGAVDYYFFPSWYFTRLRDDLRGCVHLMTVLGDDSPMGGGLFLECNGAVQYHLGATRTTALVEQPTKLMFDETWRWAKARGAREMHLGAGVGGADNPLFHFKAGFSDRRHAFGTWRLVVDTAEYDRLVERRHGVGAASADASRYFPAYRSPDDPPGPDLLTAQAATTAGR